MNNTYKTSSDFEKLYDILYGNDDLLAVGYKKEEIKIFKIYYLCINCLDTVSVEGVDEEHIIVSNNKENIWELTKDDFVNCIKELIDCYVIPNV